MVIEENTTPYRTVELTFGTNGADDEALNNVADYVLDQPLEGMPVTIALNKEQGTMSFSTTIQAGSLLNAASQVESRIRGHLSMIPTTMRWTLDKLEVATDDD